jgi:Domain of unknown function (DUF4160)
MPRISAFYGIVIRMYWNERDHPIAHFHAEHDGAARRWQSTARCSPGTFRRELSGWSAGGLICTTTSCWRTGDVLDDINQSRRSTRSPNIESWSQSPHSSTSQASR